MAAASDDLADKIIADRRAGRSMRAISRSHKVPISKVRAILDSWAATFFGSDRRLELALSVALTEDVIAKNYPALLAGDWRATNACLKANAQRATLMGLFAPQQAVVSVQPPERISSTQKIERALHNLLSPERQAEANAWRRTNGLEPLDPNPQPTAEPSIKH
jgi:hypothetical protein